MNEGYGICAVCEKLKFATRRQARQAARRLPGFGRMGTYKCSSGYWHYGHLDPKVINGTLTRDERYGDRP